MHILRIALALVAALAPTASAHVDLCTAEVCVYEWDWTWGGGNCMEGESLWWSHRVVSVSVPVDGTRHTVEAETFCSAYRNDTATSSVHVGYVTRESDGSWHWVYVDWYGSKTASGESCTIRYWGYEQDTLPEGVADEDCPVRPPLLLRA